METLIRIKDSEKEVKYINPAYVESIEKTTVHEAWNGNKEREEWVLHCGDRHYFITPLEWARIKNHFKIV